MLVDIQKQIHCTNPSNFYPSRHANTAHLDETRKELGIWLDAPDTRQVFDDFAHRRLNGTCDWILSRPEFMRWRSPSAHSPKTLWVNGPAGYGKTILSARLVEVLSTEPNVTVTYCFFSSDISSRTDPFVVIRSWIIHLITQSQSVFQLVRNQWETTDGRTASQHDIKELFNAIVQHIPECIFIVDGLDECATLDVTAGDSNGSLPAFLECLTNIISRSKSRLLIVSRNDVRIREGLRIDSNEMQGQLLELKISPNDVKADAALLSQNIVDRKLANKSDSQREELATRLVNRCDSMLLGIKLLEDDLRGGKNLKQLQRAIDEAPNKLDRIYDRNWGRILSLDHSSRQRAFSILRWTAFALRPLTVCEITECLLLQDGENDEIDYEELPDSIDEVYIRTELLELCESLVEIRPGSTCDLGDSTLHPTHFSVRQYILCHMPLPPEALTANGRLLSSIDSIQSNILAKICLRYFNCGQTLQRENANLIGTFLSYAKQYWYQHVNRGVENSHNVIRLVNELFHPSNGNWDWWVKHCGDTLTNMLEYENESEVKNRLVYASLIGLPETIDYLIDEIGLDVNYTDSTMVTALYAASTRNNSLIVTQLVERGADVNISSCAGATPLHAAVACENVEMVTLLLEMGSDILAVERQGWTSLHCAAVKGHVEMAALLLKKGSNTFAVDNQGRTSLHYAAANGHVEMAALLLEMGSDIHAAEIKGLTSLHYAAANGQFKMAALLLEMGSNIFAVDKEGWTSLHYAAFEGDVEIAALLLEKGSDIFAVNKEGCTLLHYAAFRGHVETAALLLEKGSDIFAAEIEGQTSLHYAVSEGHVKMAALLLEKGSDIFAVDKDGWTSLHYAAFGGHVEIAALLLEKGSDIFAADTYGYTSLDYAAAKGHVEMVTLLEKGIQKQGSCSPTTAPTIPTPA